VAFVGLRGVPAVYGGVDRVVEEISTGLAARGHRVTVCCWKSIYRERPREFKGMSMIYLPTLPVRYIGTLIHTFLGCLSAVRRDIDVVHINNTENSIFAFIPRLFGKKVVVQPHGPAWPILKWGTLRERGFFNFKIWLTRVYLFFCRFPTLWWSHRIVVISGPDADYISKKKTGKFVLIHNGCNIPAGKPADRMLALGIRPREYVLFVGRFDPRKGCHYLIEAFKGLRLAPVAQVAPGPPQARPGTDAARGPAGLKLVIVGGPLESTYGRFLRRLAAGDSRIIFTGPIYDTTLPELFSNALIYAHPSESEGQSISLLEGLAYGNCVVTSDTPESVETAESNAYYFKTGDATDLRRVLEEALSDPAKMDRMRAAARQHIETAYQWPDKIVEYEKLYRSLTE
jgi:glycosyltransferase involved in cell wall biosynthesis